MTNEYKIVKKAHALALQVAENEPHPQSNGLFLQQCGDDETDIQGFFLWFNDRQQWLEMFPYVCLYWIFDSDSECRPKSLFKEIRQHTRDYTHQKSDEESFIFRINNYLLPTGSELRWVGSFDNLLFSNNEIPRRTRLFCRRTLADMDEPGVDPLNDAPIEAEYLSVFTECLGDFGLEGQGLTNPIPEKRVIH